MARFRIALLLAFQAAGFSLSAQTVDATHLRGRRISVSLPSEGNILVWSAERQQWEPRPLSAAAGVSSFLGRTGAVVPQPGDYSFPMISGTVSLAQLPALIPLSRIGNGQVTGEEFSFLSGLRAPIQAQLDQKAPASHTHILGGDLSGPLASAQLVRLAGRPLATTAPSTGAVLTWDGSSWMPMQLLLGGDVAGPLTSTTVQRLRGRNVSSSPPSAGQVLAWNAAQNQWEPATIAPSSGVLQFSAGQISSGTLHPDRLPSFSGDVNGRPDALVVSRLQGRPVLNTPPLNGQALVWDASLGAWKPALPAGGGSGGGYWMPGPQGTAIFYSGPVGIGTDVPSSELHVIGTVRATRFEGALAWNQIDSLPAWLAGLPQTLAGLQSQIDSKSPAGHTHTAGEILPAGQSPGQVLSWTGSQWTPVSFAANPWQLDGIHVFYTAGNVGIGTPSPASRLHVAGDVKILGGELRVAASEEQTGIVLRPGQDSSWAGRIALNSPLATTVLDVQALNGSSYDGLLVRTVQAQPAAMLGSAPSGGGTLVLYGPGGAMSAQLTPSGDAIFAGQVQAQSFSGSLAPSMLTSAGALPGQVLKWNGTAWAPGDDLAGSGGLNVNGTSSGQILVWNGSQWTAETHWIRTGSHIYYDGGYVGIGVTAPNYPLQVAADGVGSGIRMDYQGLERFSVAPSSGGGTRMTVSAPFGPRVQLLTTPASAELQAIRSDSRIGGVLNLNSLQVYADNSSSGAGLWLQRYTGSGSSYVTAAAVNLNADFSGRILLYDGAGVERAWLEAGGQSGSLVLRDNSFLGADAIVLRGSGTSYLNGGNVGIGTASPSEKLDVAGNVKATRFVGLLDWANVDNKPSSFTPASHQHSASDITSGTLATARLGSGTANNQTFLRGDSTWAQVDWNSIQNRPASFTPAAHGHTVSDLLQSGASAWNVLAWNGTQWAATPVGTVLQNGVSHQINFAFGGDPSSDLPATTVNNVWRAHAYQATLQEVACWTDSGTVQLTLRRSDGTNLHSALTCSASGVSTTSFTDPNVNSGQGLGFTLASPSGAKTVSVSIRYQRRY